MDGLELVMALLGGAEVDEKHTCVVVGAREAFLDFGIRRASMGEIAKRSGVSPATLYRWFGSKEDVVRAVLAREVRTALLECEAAIDRASSPVDQVTEMGVQYARRAASQPLLDRMFHTEPENILPMLTRGAGPLMQVAAMYLGTYLARFVEEGRIPPLDVPVVSELLVRTIYTLFLIPTDMFPLDDSDAVRTRLRPLVARMLGTPDADDPMRANS